MIPFTECYTACKNTETEKMVLSKEIPHPQASASTILPISKVETQFVKPEVFSKNLNGS
jgi:hypothetical protein